MSGYKYGVPAVAQWNWWLLWSTGMQVQSPAQHSELRIQLCCNCGLDLIPGMVAPYATGQPKKEKKKNVWPQIDSSYLKVLNICQFIIPFWANVFLLLCNQRERIQKII